MAPRGPLSVALPKRVVPLGQGVRTRIVVGALFTRVATHLAFPHALVRDTTLTPFAVYGVKSGALGMVRFA